MNKRIFFVAIIALFLGVSAQAQLFWRISGKDLSKPSYLFGTHHLIEKEQIKNFDKIQVVAGQADVVVGEMDMTDMASMQAKIMQRAIMPGKNIKEMISAEDYSLVDNEFRLLIGAGLDQLGSFKPMMLQALYAGMIYFRSQNMTKQPEAIDVLFQNVAKMNHKQVVGLETIEQQTGVLFDSLSLSRQAEILVKSVKEKQKGLVSCKRLNEAYLAGDLVKLAELDKEDDDLTAAERRPLYEGRNNSWMKLLPLILAKQSCFVAVGCLHLVGETGLLTQLKESGYKVEAVDDL